MFFLCVFCLLETFLEFFSCFVGNFCVGGDVEHVGFTYFSWLSIFGVRRKIVIPRDLLGCCFWILRSFSFFQYTRATSNSIILGFEGFGVFW